MTYWADDSEEAARGTPQDGSGGPPVATQADPGWYPDPWTIRHHRYWNGSAWTAHAFPDGPGPNDRYLSPTNDTARPTAASQTAQWGPEDSTQTYPAPDWSAPATQTDWRPSPGGSTPATTAYPTVDWSAPATQTDWWTSPAGPNGGPPRWEQGRQSSWPPTGRTLVVLLVVMVLVVGGISMGATYLALRKPAKAVAQAPATTIPTTPVLPGGTPGTTLPGVTPSTPATPATPTSPAAAALRQIVVNQGDVPSTVGVELRDNGDQVAGEATLDLCNGTFASESLRTDRLQVDVVDTQEDILLSTEAVAYMNAAATLQAFTELKATAANCPSGPVESPVGEPTVATKFNAAPDASWPQVPGVDRLAFDFATVDSTGQTYHSVAVYLRRGRFLEGVYFPVPDGTQIAVSGQTTIAGIVNVFAVRMAEIPTSLANGTSSG
jgi:hypothetical protein